MVLQYMYRDSSGLSGSYLSTGICSISRSWGMSIVAGHGSFLVLVAVAAAVDISPVDRSCWEDERIIETDM